MEIKRQSVAFNIINNFKETEVDPIIKVTNILNENFNKGLVDELTTNQAFEELDNLIEKGMGGHKYFKREGTPGNYKYYYTEGEYKQAKGKGIEGKGSFETIEKDGKKYKLQSNGKYLEVSEQGMTKKEHLEMAEQHYENINKLLEADKVDEADKEQGRNVIHKTRASKLSSKEFTKEELKEEKDKAKDGKREDNVKFKEIHIASSKERGMFIDAILNGEKIGPVKLNKEDVNSFSDKTDRQELARKYLIKKEEKDSSMSGYVNKIMDLLTTVSSKYSNPDKVTVEATPKGNWRLYYDGKDTGSTIQGDLLSEDAVRKLQWEHHD